MKNKRLLCILVAAAVLAAFCGCFGKPDNIPYEPNTPEPPPLKGVFSSEGGTLTFNGDPPVCGDLGHGDFDLVASDFDDGDGSDGDGAFDAHVLPPMQVVGVERFSLDCAYITMTFRLYPVGYRK